MAMQRWRKRNGRDHIHVCKFRYNILKNIERILHFIKSSEIDLLKKKEVVSYAEQSAAKSRDKSIYNACTRPIRNCQLNIKKMAPNQYGDVDVENLLILLNTSCFIGQSCHRRI